MKNKNLQAMDGLDMSPWIERIRPNICWEKPCVSSDACNLFISDLSGSVADRFKMLIASEIGLGVLYHPGKKLFFFSYFAQVGK